MGTTSLTFTVSGVSELVSQIDKIQNKMQGLDSSMEKAQLSKEMSRVEKLLKEAQTFATNLFNAMSKMDSLTMTKPAEGMDKVAKSATNAAQKTTEAAEKEKIAVEKSAQVHTSASQKKVEALKKSSQATVEHKGILESAVGALTSYGASFVSIGTAVTAVTAAFAEQNKTIQQAMDSMKAYGNVAGQLGQKAESVQQMAEMENTVKKLALETGMSRDKLTPVAYAMLSAGIDIKEVKNIAPLLKAGLMSEQDLSGILKAVGPIMQMDKSINFTQAVSMAMQASKANVSDTSKIMTGVSDASFINQQIGTTTAESFAMADVIARHTANADEARTWQKNFTRDLWQKALGRYAYEKMKAIDPNATSMEGFVKSSKETKDGLKVELDPSFRASFTEVAKWMKDYYGSDMSRVNKDFKSIRSLSGVMSIMDAITKGEYEQSLADIQQAQQTNMIEKKARDTLAASQAVRSTVSSKQAEQELAIKTEPQAVIKNLWETATTRYKARAREEGSTEWGRGFGAWVSSWTGYYSSPEQQAKELLQSPYLSEEEKLDVVMNLARLNPKLGAEEYGLQDEIVQGRYSKSTGKQISDKAGYAWKIRNAKLLLQANPNATQYVEPQLQGVGYKNTGTQATLNWYRQNATAEVSTGNLAVAADKATAALENVAKTAQKTVDAHGGGVEKSAPQNGTLQPAY